MSNELKLGTIPKGDESRDAVHVAIVPAKAAMALMPGEPVKQECDAYVRCRSDEAVGIVDPFLTGSEREIQAGSWFWLCLYPKTITSLCHVWQHPQFPDARQARTSKEESEQWLRNWIKTADCPSYETVIAAALGDRVQEIEGYGEAYRIEDYGDGPRLFFSGRDGHSDIPDEFWDHLENATGRKAPVRAKGFSCSC